MSERSENQERLFQQLDDAVAEIIDRFASEGHGTARVVETLQAFWQSGSSPMIATLTPRMNR